MADVSELGADISEVCSTWLLKGHGIRGFGENCLTCS